MGIKFLFYILFLILLSNSSVSSKADAKPSGLTLKLHHRESVESNNLTDIEKFEKMIHRSKLRANLISAASNAGQPRPALAYESWNYLVETHVGTPEPKMQYMILDTGSELSWIQCEGCVGEGCFAQRTPKFDPRGSSTYSLLPCEDQLCYEYECNHDHCKFKEWDFESVHVEGFMSKDDFIFKVGGNVTVVNGLVFGCAYGTIGFGFESTPNNNITGVFGLAPGPRSFASQFAPQHRFGYCLADWHYAPPTHPGQLMFGDDAQLPLGGDLTQITKIVEVSERDYFLRFLGMQIGSKNFTFEPDRFMRKHDLNGTHGGFVIDTGMPLSFFAPELYDIVKREMVDNMKTYQLRELGPRNGLDLCWDLPNGNEYVLPSMTLLFADHRYYGQFAKLELGPRSVFFIYHAQNGGSPHFCLAILRNDGPDDKFSFLGAKQQTGNRFLFDGQNNLLSWKREDCNKLINARVLT